MNSLTHITSHSIQMDILSILAGFFAMVLLVILTTSKTRDIWDPPKSSKGTPRYSNRSRIFPITTRSGRPMIMRGESVGMYVTEEIHDMKDFLKRLSGTVRTSKQRVKISKARGRLIAWSYKPFRDGNWWEMVRSGLRDPKWPCMFGSPSMIPNPAGHHPESPLTLVTSEEDILRCVGGEVTIRVFHPNQPTFPKFKASEHGDMVCRKTIQKVKGEEFTLQGGDVLVIPRGWAYRVRLNSECVALFRVPVHGIISSIRWFIG